MEVGLVVDQRCLVVSVLLGDYPYCRGLVVVVVVLYEEELISIGIFVLRTCRLIWFDLNLYS